MACHDLFCAPGVSDDSVHGTREGAITFTVRVVTRASRSLIEGEHDEALRVRAAAPPIAGAANEELVRALARALDVPARAVEVTSGHASKLKQARVQGTNRARLLELAAAK